MWASPRPASPVRHLRTDEPVGTVHIAVSTPAGTRVRTLALAGSRAQIRAEATAAALALALECVPPIRS